jgi:hypothetical protein
MLAATEVPTFVTVEQEYITLYQRTIGSSSTHELTVFDFEFGLDPT